jgi:general secretion pathway protein I
LFRSTAFERRRSASPRRETCAGFTLIEALVALAVTAICLTAIGSLMAVNIRAPAKIEQRLGLVETLRAIEAGLPDGAGLEPGSLSGEMVGHQWMIAIDPFPDEPVNSAKPNPWMPQAIAITAQSPAGSILRIDTISMRQRPSE